MNYDVTHNNGCLRLENVGQKVTLRGWVSKVRNLGGLIFIDLRDRKGITQLVMNPENAYYQEALKVRNEFILYITGTVVERSNKNPNMPTGDIEVQVETLKIINTSLTTPIIVNDVTDALEDTRLKYRYLDLRRPCMQKYLITRSKITQSVREYFNSNDFLELETPILAKSTPEGARDYLVPSRLYHGSFYALPQSPQIFKQLFMVAGFERYFQIARCFRDEDLRADRQPEFTQIDVEMSFMTEEQIYTMIEGMFKKLWKDVLDIDLQTPFIRVPYDTCIEKYGTDKPDMRFDLFIQDMTEYCRNNEFTVIQDALKEGAKIKYLRVPNGDTYSRKIIDSYIETGKKLGAKGIAWLKVENHTLSGSVAKFFTPEIIDQCGLENHDLVFICADKKTSVSCWSLGAIRSKLGKDLGLLDENDYKFLWVTDWPLFEYDKETGNYESAHHPFTMCKEEHKEFLWSAPEKCYAQCYDIVLNGYELGSGSLRIFEQDVQQRVFEILGLSKEQIKEKFGFFEEALKYGTPPHGGIGMGLERITMLMTHTNNIKDVVAFPKTQSAKCLMSDCPSEVDPEQLNDLGISIKEEN